MLIRTIKSPLHIWLMSCECWIWRHIKIKNNFNIYGEMASRAHQNGNPRARGKVRNREIYWSWRKKLSKLSWRTRKVLRINRVEQIRNEKGNFLAYHVLDRADEPHMNLVLSLNFRTVAPAKSPLARGFSCWYIWLI